MWLPRVAQLSLLALVFTAAVSEAKVPAKAARAGAAADPAAALLAAAADAAADTAAVSNAVLSSASSSSATAVDPLSRAGLQGRRARLFAEERAAHVVATAKWAVQQALDAAARGESEVRIANFADIVPEPRNIPGYSENESHRRRPVPTSGLISSEENEAQYTSGANSLRGLRDAVRRLSDNLEELVRYEKRLALGGEGNLHMGGLGGVTLTPRAVRELIDDKKKELEAATLKARPLELELRHAREGFISLACIEDVARAIADSMPGVTVAAEAAVPQGGGAREGGAAKAGIRISWE